MKYKNILVTGGAGFIGSHLTRRLLEEGCKVTVIDDLSEGKWKNLPTHSNLTKHQGSILDNVSKVIAGKDVVFHLAALPRLQRSVANPWQTHRVNVDGTLNLLLEAKKQRVKKFIFASSSSVYGNKNKIPFKENMIPDPLVPYSLQKVMAEQYCQMFSRLWGLETICLRYFSVYGPRMNPDSPYALVLPKFIKLMSKNKAPTINGDGKQSRDFTFVSDVVEANILAGDSDLAGEIINIGAGNNVSINQLVRLLNKLLGKKINPVYGPAVSEPKVTLASNTKAKKLLGWKPKVAFGKGLQIMLKEEAL